MMLLLLVQQALSAPPPPELVRTGVVYGYLPYWEESPAEVPWSSLTHLCIFEVAANSDGSLSSLSHWTDRAAEAVSLGNASGVKVHLGVASFDGGVQHALLNSASARAKLVDALGDQVDAYGADGVNVDFEGLYGEDSDVFVTFIEELQARTGEVWIATPLVDWSGAFDYSALSAVADGLFIMGYGVHWSGGDAGPNLPLYGSSRWGAYSLEWSIDDYEAYDAILSKVVIGLPLYGQAWVVASSSVVPATTYDSDGSITYTDAEYEAAVYGKQWDEESASPWYAAGSTTQVWYDDTESIVLKTEYALDRGLGGIGFWAIGYDGGDPDFWAAIDAATTEEAGTDGGGDGGTDGGTDGGADGGTDGSGGGATDGGGVPPDHGPRDEESGTVIGDDDDGKGGCSTIPRGRAPVAGLLLVGLCGLISRDRRRGAPSR